MSKLIVLLMDNNYPFRTDITAEQRTSILVRQTLRTPRANKTTILSKANFVKNLKNKYLVKVESVLQEDQTIHVMYEYVENKLENVLKDASTFIINRINAQLNQFGRYLSNIGVRTIFTLDRMGFNDKENFKYFMGLDFQWEEDPDQDFLEQFYDKQIIQIMGHYIKKKQLMLASPRKESASIMSKEIQPLIKQRKISYSTLPKRYSRIQEIDQKLKQIKSSSKFNNIVQHRTPKSMNTIKYASNFLKKQPGFPKKADKRKYSDINCDFESKQKLQEKESDIQSQYWQRKKKSQTKIKQRQAQMRSQADTNKTKSRTDEMRQKQYRQILSLPKEYTKDFLQVLQQDEENAILPVQSNRNTEQKTQELVFKRTDSFFAECNQESTSTEKLQLMAKQAIAHSLKVISKFKSIIR